MKHLILFFCMLPVLLAAQQIESKSDQIKKRSSTTYQWEGLQVKSPGSLQEYAQKATSRTHNSPFASYHPISFPLTQEGASIIQQHPDGRPKRILGPIPFSAPLPESQDPTDAALERFAQEVALPDPLSAFTIDRLNYENGRFHAFYQQRHNEIPIYGAELQIHFTDQFIFHAVQDAQRIPENLPTEAAFSPEASIAKTYQSLSLSKKAFMPSYLVEKDETKLYYMQAEDGSWHLAYRTVIHPTLDQRIISFIDAQSGDIIQSYESICKFHGISHTDSEDQPVNGPVTATARDLSGTLRTINLYEQDNEYYMIDASRAMYNASASSIPNDPKGAIVTLDAKNTSPQDQNFTVELVSNSNNDWSRRPAVVSSQYNAGVAYEYFQQTFDRNAIDGAGGTMLSLINVSDQGGGGLDNAFWNGKAMFYGNGDVAFSPLAEALDVAGHEMSHGVIQNTANLEYMNESGAINESFADIFGAMIDREDWQLAEDIVNTTYFPSGAMRDMQNPNQGGTKLGDPGWQPAHYDERYTGTQNNGGVHINSGICNRAYYLFATAIGRDKAEQIYYHALTNYLSRRSNFQDLRSAIIQSANDLYQSTEADAAASAFAQVGIGSSGGGNPTNQGYPILSENPGDDYVLHANESGTSMHLKRGNGQVVLDNIIPTGALSKPSITDRGDAIFFINQEQLVSYITIDWQMGQSSAVQTLELRDGNGNLISWANAAVSKDGRLLALVPDVQEPILIVLDLATNNNELFELYNPTFSQTNTTTNSVVGADALEFDHAGQTIIYDAFNRLQGGFGFTEEYWDINLIEVWNPNTQSFTDGNISPLFSALPDGVSIGNPAYAKNATGVIAFDYIQEDLFETQYAVLGLDASTSTVATIFEGDRLGFPSYSRLDDYLLINAANTSGQAVVGQIPLAANRIEASDNGAIFASGYWGVWFSNGDRALTSALSSISDKLVTIFPNPASDQLRIRMNESQRLQAVHLLSLHGVLYQSWQANGAVRLDLELPHLPSGMYMLKMETEDQSFYQSVILQN